MLLFIIKSDGVSSGGGDLPKRSNRFFYLVFSGGVLHEVRFVNITDFTPALGTPTPPLP